MTADRRDDPKFGKMSANCIDYRSLLADEQNEGCDAASGSSALSEIASKGNTGVDVDLSKVRLREEGMSPSSIMIPESQERMIVLLPPQGGDTVLATLRKYDVPYSVIGTVTNDGMVTIRMKEELLAHLPAEFVATRRDGAPDEDASEKRGGRRR